MYLPTICLWVFLENFNKSSAAFTSAAVVLHESTRAHFRKGSIVSNEKKLYKSENKNQIKVIWLNSSIYLLTRMMSTCT